MYAGWSISHAQAQTMIQRHQPLPLAVALLVVGVAWTLSCPAHGTLTGVSSSTQSRVMKSLFAGQLARAPARAPSNTTYQSSPTSILEGSGSLVFTLRFLGKDMLPFSVATQSTMLRTLQQTVGTRVGPSVIRNFAEGYATEDGTPTPFVDVELQLYDTTPRAFTSNSSAAYDYAQSAFGSFVAWVLGMRAGGLNVTVRIMSIQNPPLDIVTQRNFSITMRPVRSVQVGMTLCLQVGEDTAYQAVNTAVEVVRDHLTHRFAQAVIAGNASIPPDAARVCNDSSALARHLILRATVGVCTDDAPDGQRVGGEEDDLFWCWADPEAALQQELNMADRWLIDGMEAQGTLYQCW